MIFWGIIGWCIIGVVMAARLMGTKDAQEVQQLVVASLTRAGLPSFKSVIEVSLLWWAGVLWPLTAVILWRNRRSEK